MGGKIYLSSFFIVQNKVKKLQLSIFLVSFISIFLSTVKFDHISPIDKIIFINFVHNQVFKLLVFQTKIKKEIRVTDNGQVSVLER